MTADSAPEAVESERLTFASMGLTPDVLRALEEIGYETPTPVQHATYKPAIAGTDIIVQARTGTGKTAAFGIPLVDRIISSDKGVQALVLAPTRELALQSARELSRLGKYRELTTVAVYGGAPMGGQIRDLANGAQIVSGTPGRVLDHLRRGTLDASAMRVLVLDEMDEMLSMGFAKELNAILEIIPDESKRQTMCFSATVDGAVRRHAMRHMRDPEIVSLSSDAVGAEQITHSVYMVTGSNRTGDLIQILNVEDPETAIIFCNMRSETERVAAELQKAGFNADWLNGDLPQRDRERIMARTRESKLRYLVATDVAARGIDVSHLTHVINYSFPESAATYVHRTGRTGRAGRTGAAISLVSPQELGRLYYLRLEYKINPIERALPSAGENRTQAELDRLKLLEASMTGPPKSDELALARRLMTHPDGERILGGLLRAFFGGEEKSSDVDGRAAQGRRDRPAPAVASPGRERYRDRDDRPERSRDDRPARSRDDRPERSRDDRSARTRDDRPERSRDDRPERSRSRSDDDSSRSGRSPRREGREAREGESQEPRQRTPRDRGRDRDRRDRDPERAQVSQDESEAQLQQNQAAALADSEIQTVSADDASTTPARERSTEGRRRRRNRRRQPGGTDASGASSESAPLNVINGSSAPDHSEPQAAESSDHEAQDSVPPRERRSRERSERRSASPGQRATSSSTESAGGFEPDASRPAATVFLNVGRRDGLELAEVVDFMRDAGELSKGDVGRIRLRDRYTYVDVPEELVDEVVSRLEDKKLHDRRLSPERAKVTRS